MSWINPFDSARVGGNGSSLVYSDKVTITTPPGGSAPTKPALLTTDNITVIDDASGFCRTFLNLSYETSGMGANPGIGIYLFGLSSGAPAMDLNFHKPVTNGNFAISGMIEASRLIGNSVGYISRSDGQTQSLVVYPYDSTRFFLAVWNNWNKIRSDFYQLHSNYSQQSYQAAFTYKKA